MMLGGRKPLWQKFFHIMRGVFDRKFGPDWKERSQFLKEFLDELHRSARVIWKRGERGDRS